MITNEQIHNEYVIPAYKRGLNAGILLTLMVVSIGLTLIYIYVK